MAVMRIGFVGAGFIAGVHAGILARDPRAAVTHVCDPDPQRADLFALRHGAAAVSSLDDLLASVDAVYICSPNAYHAEAAVLALDAGLHVFSEKPMATSLEDGARVLDAARRSRGVYQAGFNRRLAPLYLELKAHVDGADRPPASALLKMNRGELQRPAWTGDPAVSGGYMYETPVHMLDLVRHLFGDPVEIVVRARAVVYDQLDDFSMLFTFATGMSAVFASSAHATWLFPFERLEVYGDHTAAVTEEMERITISDGVGAPARVIDLAQLPFEERWGYVAEDARFLDAVSGMAPPAVTAEDAFATTALVAACYERANEARPQATDR